MGMVSVDKTSKVPLYLQIKDKIKYALSTGAIRSDEQLPGVVELGRELQVNFETVRKAYKELEKEGVVRVRRGQGTFAGPAAPLAPTTTSAASHDRTPSLIAHTAVRQLMARGLSPAEIRELFESAVREVADVSHVIFAECNTFEVNSIASLLEQQLQFPVKGLLVDELRAAIDHLPDPSSVVVVVTTGFHLGQVRRLLADTDIDVEAIVTNMSPDTRRELERQPKTARFGFVCRDEQSIPFYREMLRSELGLAAEPRCLATGSEGAIATLVPQLDVLLVSPPVFDIAVRASAGRIPVFNVLDRVDPVSLLAIRERVFRDLADPSRDVPQP